MTRVVRRRPLEAAASPRSGSLRLMTLISEIFKSQVCLSLTPLRGVSETETGSPASVRPSETSVRLRQGVWGVRRRPLMAAAAPRSGSLMLMTLISKTFRSQVCLSLTPLRGVSETETGSPVSVRRSETLVRLRQTGFTETFYTPSEQGKHQPSHPLSDELQLSLVSHRPLVWPRVRPRVKGA